MLSGQLCRCTGYAPIVTRSPRSPEREPRAQPPLRGRANARRRGARRRGRARSPTRSCASAPRGSPPASRRAASSAATASHASSRTARDGRALLGVPVARRASSSRSRIASRTTDLEYCIDGLRGGSRHPRQGDVQELAAGRRAPRRARPRRARAVDPALHLRHDRAAEGRPALAPRRARRRALAGRPPRPPPRHRTLGVMPLYHTMGIHSLLAMHLVGGCFVASRRWDPEQALRADRARADRLPLPRPHALPRPRPPPALRRRRPRRPSAPSPTRARR